MFLHSRLWTRHVDKSFFVASADLARGMAGQLTSSCWRAEKYAKDWMSKNKSKSKNNHKQKQTQQNQTTKPTQNPERTSSNLSETMKRFRTTNPPDHSVPLHKDVGIFRQLNLYQ